MYLVADTNIWLLNPNFYEGFKDCILVIPQVVIEELDSKKTSFGVLGLNARQSLKKIGEIAKKYQTNEDFDFVDLDGYKFIIANTSTDKDIWEDLDNNTINDNKIISTAFHTSKWKKGLVSLLSNDCNVRTKVSLFYKKYGVKSLELVEGEVKTSDYYHIEKVNVEDEIISKLYNGNLYITDLELETNVINTPLYLHNRDKTILAVIKQKGQILPLKQDKKNNCFNIYGGIKPLNDCQKQFVNMIKDNSIKIIGCIGKTGSGKAEPNSTPIPTPNGDILMGDLKIGDYVFDKYGNPTKILGVYPQGMQKTMMVEFSDGRKTECAEDHLWTVYTDRLKFNYHKNKNTKGYTMTTKQIMQLLEDKRGAKFSLFIPVAKPVQYSKKELKIHPYALGALIGDGCLTCYGIQISSNEEDVVQKVANCLNLEYSKANINNYSWRFNTTKSKNRWVKQELTYMGLNCLAKYKFIPKEYLESDIEDRKELLCGLMDTDGTVGNKNRFSYSTSSQRLAVDVATLGRSLGYICNIRKTIRDRDNVQTIEYSVSIQTNDIIFSSKKHIERYNNNIKKYHKIGKFYNDFIRITNVYYTGKEDECTCIYVDNDEHLYLSKDYVVTHNTLIALATALKLVEDGEYAHIKLIKPYVSLGNTVGLLRGTLEDKVSPIKESFNSALECMGLDLDELEHRGTMSFAVTEYERGKTYVSSLVIIDEAQNLSSVEIKSLITRCGESSKVILLGDTKQIDSLYLSENYNGLSYVIDRLNGQDFFGAMYLNKSERAKFIDIVDDLL